MATNAMKRSKLQALAKELAKDIKTEADLSTFSRELLKLKVETALNTEPTKHLGNEKYQDSTPSKGNSENAIHNQRP